MMIVTMAVFPRVVLLYGLSLSLSHVDSSAMEQSVDISAMGDVEASMESFVPQQQSEPSELIDEDDDYWNKYNDDEIEDDWEEEDLGSEFGVAQEIGDDHQSLELLEKTKRYFATVVNVNETYAPVRNICKNKHEQCTSWAAQGECEANPSYMQVNCAPACQTCEMVHVSFRCPLDPTAADALYPGGLDDLFERIVQDPALQVYEPKVLSRPYYANGDGPENADYQLGLWLVVFDNILNEQEAKRLIDLGEQRNMSRSADVGDLQEDGTYGESISESRTSTNAWCEEECYNDTIAQQVAERMEHITGIPEENAEHFQLLRYEPGQKYDVSHSFGHLTRLKHSILILVQQMHNDYIEYQIDRPCGVRILTFYMYLNDVAAGGETAFPRLGLKVKPKLGRAVLWPSVFNDNPNKNDIRSDHAALPVLEGIKYGANAWYHQRNVKSEHSMNCL